MCLVWELVIHPSSVAACLVAHCPLPARRREPENNLRGEHACLRLRGWHQNSPHSSFSSRSKAKYDTIHLQLQPSDRCFNLSCASVRSSLGCLLTRSLHLPPQEAYRNLCFLPRNIPELASTCQSNGDHHRGGRRSVRHGAFEKPPLSLLLRLLAYALSYFSPLFLLVCYSEE